MQNNSLPQRITSNSISLLLGHPDPTTLFTPPFQDAVNRVLTSKQPHQALEYGQDQGNSRLVEYLIEKFSREQRIPLGADQLMLVAGSTHAVDMIARLHTKPGDAVIVEAPTYADTLHIFRDHGVALYSVPIDEDGVTVAEMEALLKRLFANGQPARLFYTIPNFHNPTGVTLTEQGRIEIVRLAKQYGFIIVEDDVYRDLVFDTSVPPSFFALADGTEVMHIGSFSKTLAPGLRLGWLVSSGEAIQRFMDCGTTQMGGGANPFSAQVVAEYCGQGSWDAHIEHLRDLYRMRRDVMLAALERYMPDGVTWTKPAGGFFIWVSLPDDVQSRDVKAQSLQRGVMVAAGEGYFVEPSHGAHHLRLTYSFAPPEDIETAVRILAEVIEAST